MNHKNLTIIILIVFIILNSLVLFYKKNNSNNTEPTKNEIQITGMELEEQKFNEKEAKFFVKRDLQFSKKYTGKTETGLSFSLLLISSNSWRTHHNPELCIEGTGYEINSSEIFKLDNPSNSSLRGDSVEPGQVLTIRKLSLDNGQTTIVYWFTNGKETIMDYSGRVWKGMKNPDDVWTLIEIGFKGDIDLQNQEILDLIYNINDHFKS